MGKIITDFSIILSQPYIYRIFQYLMGAHKQRMRFISDIVRPVSGNVVLDIGCGTADILNHLPSVYYWGFDISQAYIDHAKARFGDKGNFLCKKLQADDLNILPKFDIVLALGLLHHLDDIKAKNILTLAYQALKPGCRLITIDPSIESEQNPIARFLVTYDRGQYVRTSREYAALVYGIFLKPIVKIIHRSWIPYTHCTMECIRP